VYEGGFKAWEGGEALARLLAGDARPGAPVWGGGELAAGARAAASRSLAGLSILELGAGAALPSLVAARRGAAALDLADYNPSVLECLTAVNVREATAGRGRACAVRFWAGDWRGLAGVLLVGRDAAAAAAAAAATAAGTAPSSPSTPPWALIFAAEVTYAPESLAPFLDCLAKCLHAGGALALVAAKRYYFGVGGGSADLVAGAVGAGLEAGVVASTGGGGVEVPIDVVAVRRRRG
jgi:predicted nicotinamide N-methyase